MVVQSVLILMFLLTPSGAEAPVVENGLEPVGAVQTLVFTADLRINEDSDDDHVWSGAYPTISADSKGNMYVADRGESRVLVFDQTGTFLKQIGGRGKGPGEFESLMSYQVLADDRAVGFGLVGYAFPMFYFYGQGGEFLKGHLMEDRSNLIQSIVFAPSGAKSSVFTISVAEKSGKLTFKTGIADHRLNVVKTLSEKQKPGFNPRKIRDQNYWAKFIGENIKTVVSGYGVVGFDSAGNVYTALSTDYQITKWSPDLQTKLLVIKKAYKPIPYSDEERAAFAERQAWNAMGGLPPALRPIITPVVIKKAIARADLPPVKSPILGISVTERGTILVLRDVNEATRRCMADLFNPEGRFIGTTEVEDFAYGSTGDNQRMRFRNGVAYSFETDEDDTHTAVRYKYDLVTR